MWIPPEEKDPIVFQEPTRFHTSVFGAVNVRTGKFVHQMSETVTGGVKVLIFGGIKMLS